MKHLLPALLCCASAVAGDADWPTWRHDAKRSGATAHALPGELIPVWSRDLGKPDPAFDYHFRLCADQANEPVAASGMVFVPSNTSDCVTAYDLEIGVEKWCFMTEGPVRFAPIVSDGAVVFGSDDGFLYCVDAASGALKWKTRGVPGDRADHRMLINGRLCSRWPVRGGPMLHDGVIYFGCGVWPGEGVFVVALDAKTGAVKWRNADIAQIDDGLEEHGQMADLGLPPHGYLAFIAGRVAMPSGRALAAFLEPQSGRLDPYNSYYAKYYPVPRGSWALCGNSDYWFQGGAIMGTSGDALEKLPAGPVSIEDFAKFSGKDVAWAEDMVRRKFIKSSNGMVTIDLHAPGVGIDVKRPKLSSAQLFQMAERPVLNMAQLGTRHEVGERGMPVFADKLMFRSEFKDPRGVEVERGVTRVATPKYDVLRCYQLDEAFWKLNLLPSKRGQPVQRNLEFPVAWELPVEGLTVKLLAGDRLYLGGDDKLVAIDTTKHSIVWQAKVDGYPVGCIAASGHLIVTTDRGKMHVFGSEPNARLNGVGPEFAVFSKPADTVWPSQVKSLKKQLPGAGIVLVLGWNSGGLARQLAEQTTMQVIVAEPDAGIASKARNENFHLSASARRIHIVSGLSDVLKLPPYFAEVVLSENFNDLDQGARIWTRIALDALRPHTGIALLPLRPKLIDQAKAYVEKDGGYEFSTDNRLTMIRRIAAPKGADDWTHESAGAGNTFASHDALARPPFGLLWYSGGIDREFSPAFEFHHNRNPYPVIVSGRLFMLAANELHAVDAYTGRHLWKTSVPESPKSERRLGDHRTFSRPTDQNLIAAADRVYVIGEAEALMFAAADGKAMGRIGLAGTNASLNWDEARIIGGTLIVAQAKKLFALDRLTGAQLWTRASEQEHTSFGLSDDRVFVIDYTTARSSTPAKADAIETKLAVLNVKTGEPLWSEPLKAGERPEQGDFMVGKPKWSGVFQDNPLKPTLHYNAAHNIALAIVDRCQFFAFDATSGSPLWQYQSKSSLADLVSFEPPTITSDLVICDDGTMLDVRTGKASRQVGGRGTGCNRFVGSDALITFRSALACFLDLDNNQRTCLSSTRPGCTNSMIPAAGLLNAPNYAHGCVCNYPFLTSFALFHLPDAAKWAPRNKPDVQTQRNPNAN